MFAYMPTMHSASALVHTPTIALFSQPGMQDNLDVERPHPAIIDSCGRVPLHNTILGRPSNAEQLTFLRESGSSFWPCCC